MKKSGKMKNERSWKLKEWQLNMTRDKMGKMKNETSGRKQKWENFEFFSFNFNYKK